MISIRNLCVVLNNTAVLKHVDLDLNDGESLVVLGCSGIGKSVLLKSILGLLPIESGDIIINGVNIAQANRKERAAALYSIGMLFQGGALFDSLPVWENVAFGLIYGKQMAVPTAKKIAIEKLALVDLDKKIAELYPASLSGGMQKRVGLARALALDPKIVFFDEPTTGLDPITSEIVNQLIVKSVKDFGIGAITITHDINCLRHIADTVSFLASGRIVWKGPVAEIDTTADPYIRQFLDAKPEGPCRVA
jgi:phospholipid/cholesterol/gamma-HCH transport system ATP-binding protein